MKKFDFIRPAVTSANEESLGEYQDYYGEFTISPLERGYANTLGNALRRVLLSSMPGVAIVGVKIEGVNNEFMALPGIREDVTAIILNLKSIILKVDADRLYSAHMAEQMTLDDLYTLRFDGTVPAGEFKAGDLEYDKTVLQIVNPGQVIATFAEERPFTITLYARRGIGYVGADENKAFAKDVAKQTDVEIIPIDAIYTPVKRVNYAPDTTRVEGDVNFEKLTMQIWTNCSVKPKDVLALAAQFLCQHFNAIAVQSNESIAGSDYMPVEQAKESGDKEVLKLQLDDLNLSVRAFNSLSREGIRTVGELCAKTEGEMMKIRNLGRKTYKEIEKALAEFGLSFAKENPDDDDALADLDEPLADDDDEDDKDQAKKSAKDDAED